MSIGHSTHSRHNVVSYWWNSSRREDPTKRDLKSLQRGEAVEEEGQREGEKEEEEDLEKRRRGRTGKKQI